MENVKMCAECSKYLPQTAESGYCRKWARFPYQDDACPDFYPKTEAQKELAAIILDDIQHSTPPAEAIQNQKNEGFSEDEVKDAVSFLLQFLADHTYYPSFIWQNNIKDPKGR